MMIEKITKISNEEIEIESTAISKIVLKKKNLLAEKQRIDDLLDKFK